MHPFARFGFTAALALALNPAVAQAKVHIAVDLDRQTMHVEANGQAYDWKVSSGKPGYETPAGSFKVLWMDKDHYSDTYDGAHMPNAIFFAPGYAIHGFGKSPWGHKASHGCVRIPLAKSEMLFDLVKAQGADVTITGYSPTVAPTVASVEAARSAKSAATPDDRDDADGRQAAPVAAPPQRAAPSGFSLFGGVF